MGHSINTSGNTTSVEIASRVSERRQAQQVCIELCAHNALSALQARWFLITVAVGPLLTAGYCVWQGFWPVLPFAGLELGLVWWALRWSMYKGRRRETILVSPDFITVLAQVGTTQANTRFPRHWTRVRLCAASSALHPCRLYLESQGRASEVGSFLTEDERRNLATRLKQLIGNMNDSPAL